MATESKRFVNVSKVCNALGLFVHWCDNCHCDKDSGETWCGCGKWDNALADVQAKEMKDKLTKAMGSRKSVIERLDAMCGLAPLEGGGIDRKRSPIWRASKLEAR